MQLHLSHSPQQETHNGFTYELKAMIKVKHPSFMSTWVINITSHFVIAVVKNMHSMCLNLGHSIISTQVN